MKTTKSAEQIIKEAMTDEAVYKKMAQKESKFWGNLLSNPKRNERVKRAQHASAALNKNRGSISLVGFIRERKLKFEKGLVLGCGSGRAERNFIAQGICESFHGIDISEKAIEEGRKLAAEEGLPITYELADLNFVKLPSNEFDFICAQTSLHHVLHLEHLIEQIWNALKPGGIFWVHDFVGESQFQWTDERIEIVTALRACLPEKFSYDAVNERPVPELTRPNPGTLGSPFESIRSGEIAPILKQWFHIERQHEWGSIMRHLMPPGVLENFLENDDTRALFEVLICMDSILLKHNVLPPTGAQYILRAKPNKPNKRPKARWRELIHYFWDLPSGRQ